MNSVKSGRKSAYGTPPPVRKHAATLARRWASMASVWLPAARFRLDVPVRQTACSGGSVNARAAGAYSTIPPVVTAPSHSRT